ncbi:hypothetical protein ABZ471_31910, partial [Streptomyces sp. NPDC005728]|uniref:hypothetical protein n=1 Tax=Streptomyces sp. NPDC005728 TaxID=3157054 RepID=UPI0033D8CDAB
VQQRRPQQLLDGGAQFRGARGSGGDAQPQPARPPDSSGGAFSLRRCRRTTCARSTTPTAT